MRQREFLWWIAAGLLLMGASAVSAAAASRTRSDGPPVAEMRPALAPNTELTPVVLLPALAPLAPRSAFSCKSGEVAMCKPNSSGATDLCVSADHVDRALGKGATLADAVYPDADADSYGEMGTLALNACVALDGYVGNDGDCDDADAMVNPGGSEECDAIDNNCDGQVDEGACERIVFLTSSMHTGNLGGLAGADAICAARASEAGLPGLYLAFLSGADPMSAPRSRFTYPMIPYVRVDGVVVAVNFFDLINGDILNPINITENGDFAGSTGGVWTNTDQSGMQKFPNIHCNDWSDDRPIFGLEGHNGNFGRTDFLWTSGGISVCSRALPLYCFQQ